MKALAVLWTADGHPMALVDTSDPHGLRLEAHLQRLRQNFPESKPRMAMVEVTEVGRVNQTTETCQCERRSSMSTFSFNLGTYQGECRICGKPLSQAECERYAAAFESGLREGLADQ